MCLKQPNMKTPDTPSPPPPPAASEKAQTPVIGDNYGPGDTINSKRKGRTGLTIPLGGLNIPR